MSWNRDKDWKRDKRRWAKTVEFTECRKINDEIRRKKEKREKGSYQEDNWRRLLPRKRDKDWKRDKRSRAKTEKISEKEEDKWWNKKKKGSNKEEKEEEKEDNCLGREIKIGREIKGEERKPWK